MAENRLSAQVGHRISLVLRNKFYPVSIARFRPAKFGRFWPVFFFADHTGARVLSSFVFLDTTGAECAIFVRR